jgi:hypothetical protein
VNAPPPQTREELIEHLEQLTGRSLKTREDIQAYVREIAARKASNQPSVKRWMRAKQLTLAALLAFGVMQYYMLDVMLEIVSMQSTTFFVPVKMQMMKS